jgi:hypothetical protein
LERRIGARLEGGWDKQPPPPPVDWIKIAKILEEEAKRSTPPQKDLKLKVARLLREGKIEEANKEWEKAMEAMMRATLDAIGRAAGSSVGP